MGLLCSNSYCRHVKDSADCYGCDGISWTCCKCNSRMFSDWNSFRPSSPASSIGSNDTGPSVPPRSKKSWPTDIFADFSEFKSKIESESKSESKSEKYDDILNWNDTNYNIWFQGDTGWAEPPDVPKFSEPWSTGPAHPEVLYEGRERQAHVRKPGCLDAQARRHSVDAIPREQSSYAPETLVQGQSQQRPERETSAPEARASQNESNPTSVTDSAPNPYNRPFCGATISYNYTFETRPLHPAHSPYPPPLPRYQLEDELTAITRTKLLGDCLSLT